LQTPPLPVSQPYGRTYEDKVFRMKALLVIDMQVGLFEGDPPRYDADGVIQRVNEIAKNTRATGGTVIFINMKTRKPQARNKGLGDPPLY
jgi:nicotinamidase-related amidase